jgi:hypothetical protein
VPPSSVTPGSCTARLNVRYVVFSGTVPAATYSPAASANKITPMPAIVEIAVRLFRMSPS